MYSERSTFEMNEAFKVVFGTLAFLIGSAV